MQVSFKRHLKGSYMIVEEMEGPKEKYELMMLLDNRIYGLLPLQVFQKETYIEYWYDITGMQSLTSYLEREKIRSDVLLGIVYGLKDICTELTNYLLEENRISLNEDFIYLNYATKQLSFVYLPFQNGNIYTEFQTLMELIIRKMDHSDKEAVEIGYGLYQSAQRIGVGLYELLEQVNFKENNLEMIDEKEQDEQEELSHNSMIQKKNSGKQIIEEKKDVAIRKKGSILCSALKNNLFRLFHEKKKVFLKRKTEFIGTTEKDVKKADGAKYNNIEDNNNIEYIKVSAMNMPDVRLVSQENVQSEDILIDKDSFLIGNSVEASDGYILHKSISSMHARIERVEKIFYLEDLNSEKGTYLNGKILEYREKVVIDTGDIITFGTQSYRFTR